MKNRTVNVAASISMASAAAQRAIGEDQREWPDGTVIYGPIRSSVREIKVKPNAEERRSGAKAVSLTIRHCRVQVGVVCGYSPRGVLVMVMRRDGTPCSMPKVWDVRDASAVRPSYLFWINETRVRLDANGRAFSDDLKNEIGLTKTVFSS